MLQTLKAWLIKQLSAPETIAAPAHSTGATSQNDHEVAQNVVPYDETLLERSRTQWQFGDWESLAKLERDTLQHHPDRAKLALLAAAGHLQQGNSQAACQFTRLAQDWGCSKKLISQILISGVHNSLGRSAAIAGHQPRSLNHFNSAVAIGSPGSEQRLLVQARLNEQCTQLGLPATQVLPRSQNEDSIGMVNPRAAYKPASQKPLVRTIHHLSCTGGTLFAKCLAALPKTVVLNEIDPHSSLALDANEQAPFNPRDIISLLHQSQANFDTNLIDKIFLNDIEMIASELSKNSIALVLRDHAHSAYLTGAHKRHCSTLKQLLGKRFQCLGLVTVRDPIDSYLSLQNNGWIHYNPSTFDEYCKRYIQFLEDHSDLRVFKYESLVESPQRAMREIANELQLEYSPDFEDHFFDFKFSGDSGRSGSLIEPRSRREYNDDFISEAKSSQHYQVLIKLLDYPPLC
jgi:hypothetical protein